MSELISLSAADIGRKCRLPHSEVQEILKVVFDDLSGPLMRTLGDVDLPRDDVFTTGDSSLDKALGAGVRTRKIWEIVGER